MQKMILLALALLVPACSYRFEKEIPGTKKNPSSAAISFSDVQAIVFQPNCARCHGGDVVASYESVKANLSEITRRMQLQGGGGAMPPGGPISSEALQIYLAWVNAGAPREPAKVDPTPDPVPGPLPTVGGFDEIKQKVLEPKCARCHAGMVGSYASVKANIKDIDEAISQGWMPPSRSAQLTEEEKQLILRWIAAGAPEAPQIGSSLIHQNN
jgi:uncharacterized membrane protein